MENLQKPAPVTPVELLTRQLHDWRQLHSQLLESNQAEPSHQTASQIEYCAAMIDNFEADLTMLTKSKQ